jgi:hypothetical protein
MSKYVHVLHYSLHLIVTLVGHGHRSVPKWYMDINLYLSGTWTLICTLVVHGH